MDDTKNQVYKLSGAFFQAANMVGIRGDRARARRFQIVGVQPYDCLRLRRLDLKSGRIESYHKGFIIPVEARDV